MRLILVILYINSAVPLKILGLFPYSGKSHFKTYEPLLQELAKRQHEIHVLSEFPQQKPIKGYKDLILQTNEQSVQEILDLADVPPKWVVRYGILYFAKVLGDKTCAKLNQKVVKNLLITKEKYDLILIEHFNTDCFLGFAHKMKIPHIALSSCYFLPWHYDRFGQVGNPSFVPNHFGDFGSKMTFLERLENSFMYLYTKIFYKMFVENPGNMRAKEFFGDDLPPLRQIAENSSLLLINNYFALNEPKSLPPRVIEIGGMHIGTHKILPTNIEKWVNESKDGVVYFSMGSMIIGHSFPEDKRRMFQNAFSKLKQRVLWKWENDTMPGKPNNVMIQKWMPQLDILCHPNVKVFIGHAGLLGTTEAVHCGVPAILMPQFGDQFVNAKGLEASGGGVILDFGTITEESILKALKTVLEPSFKKQAEELSARFKDRPMSPLDTAIYWIEYVARHKGAPHLRTAAVGMPFYQYLLLDVIGFVLAVTVVSYLVLARILKFVFGKLCGSSKAKTKKVKKS